MDPVVTTALRLGDNAMVLGQRLGHWVSRSPTIELDVGFANQALDLIGQANLFYELAGRLEGKERSADDIAYLRDPHEFFNIQLVEQPNGDFAQTMMRQVLYATWAQLVFEFVAQGSNADLAAVAAKAEKEMAYHVRHSGEWMIRLGDGTEESHQRSQAALDFMWPWTHELFAYDDVDEDMVALGVLPDKDWLKSKWDKSLSEVFQRTGLSINDEGWQPAGGRQGVHSEHLSYLLEEMQVLPRTHPGTQW